MNAWNAAAEGASEGGREAHHPKDSVEAWGGGSGSAADDFEGAEDLSVEDAGGSAKRLRLTEEQARAPPA